MFMFQQVLMASVLSFVTPFAFFMILYASADEIDVRLPQFFTVLIFSPFLCAILSPFLLPVFLPEASLPITTPPSFAKKYLPRRSVARHTIFGIVASVFWIPVVVVGLFLIVDVRPISVLQFAVSMAFYVALISTSTSIPMSVYAYSWRHVHEYIVSSMDNDPNLVKRYVRRTLQCLYV
jgi:EamA domain-containing membrane protein RarD